MFNFKCKSYFSFNLRCDVWLETSSFKVLYFVYWNKKKLNYFYIIQAKPFVIFSWTVLLSMNIVTWSLIFIKSKSETFALQLLCYSLQSQILAKPSVQEKINVNVNLYLITYKRIKINARSILKSKLFSYASKFPVIWYFCLWNATIIFDA